ncbi:unnamed protein product, partial [Lota lota]
YSSRVWTSDCQPQFWSKYQVWEWLQQMMDVYQIDASSMPLHNFDMDGCQLCSMSYQDFLHAAGSVGAILYHSLAELKLTGGLTSQTPKKNVDLLMNYFNVLLGAKHPVWLFRLPFIKAEAGKRINYLTTRRDLLKTLIDFKTLLCTLVFLQSTSHVHSPTQATFLQANPRGSHLWEFIRDILLHPERNPGLIKWEDRTEGVFRFLKSEAVAQLWGRRKNNSSMTYEKLSRAMRYYYKREILERVDGRRLVYKFGRNARGWKELET